VGAVKPANVIATSRTLTELYLSSNKIGDSGASELARTIAGNRLTDLNLSENKIGDVGAAELAKALAANSTLTNFSLWDNKVTQGLRSL